MKKKSMNIYILIKRIFDIIFGLIGIIMLIPCSIIVFIGNICTGDYHCIFLIQKRIGLKGREFYLFKYRSMVVNADEELTKILKENKKMAKEYKINKKIKNDPRITKFGKFMRKIYLDELPQVINVFIGNMSLIGNRPYLPREKKDMGNYYEEIVKTKPGITGYWQVSGTTSKEFTKRLELEKYYSNNRSFILDMKIFFKTFKVILNSIINKEK